MRFQFHFYRTGDHAVTFTPGNTAPTVAQSQALVQALGYTDTTVKPTAGTRSFTISITDNYGTSAFTDRVVVPGVEAAPTLSASTSVFNYTGGHSPIGVAGAITLADTDDTHLSSARIAIAQPQIGDVLTLDTSGTSISASFDPLGKYLHYDSNFVWVTDITGTGILTLTGSDTLAHYQQVLRSLTFASAATTVGDRQLIVSVTDDHSGTQRTSVPLGITVHDLPGATLTSVNPLSGDSLEDTVRTISYADLTTAAQGETSGAVFILSDIHGTLQVRHPVAADGFTTWAAVTSGTVFDSTEELRWTPDANANGNGNLTPFSIVVTDGAGGLSGAPIPVYASVTPVNDPTTGSLVVNGSIASAGSVLTIAQNNLVDGDGMGAVTYHWQINSGSHASSNWADISGAPVGTAPTSYTLSASDLTHEIRVQVAYTDGGGTAETYNQILNTPASGSIAVTTSASALSASIAGITDPNGIPTSAGAVSYQWQTVAPGTQHIYSFDYTYTYGGVVQSTHITGAPVDSSTYTDIGTYTALQQAQDAIIVEWWYGFSHSGFNTYQLYGSPVYTLATTVNGTTTTINKALAGDITLSNGTTTINSVRGQLLSFRYQSDDFATWWNIQAAYGATDAEKTALKNMIGSSRVDSCARSWRQTS